MIVLRANLKTRGDGKMFTLLGVIALLLVPYVITMTILIIAHKTCEYGGTKVPCNRKDKP